MQVRPRADETSVKHHCSGDENLYPISGICNDHTDSQIADTDYTDDAHLVHTELSTDSKECWILDCREGETTVSFELDVTSATGLLRTGAQRDTVAALKATKKYLDYKSIVGMGRPSPPAHRRRRLANPRGRRTFAPPPATALQATLSPCST